MAGTGGGSLQLTVTGTLRLDGEINANGTAAGGGGCVGGNPAAGGRAGSIFVTAGTLTIGGS
jgi:hypothetical protein